jgi:hypothetical protein
MTSVLRREPDRGAISGPLTGAIFLGALLGAGKLAESDIPQPGSDADAIRKYFTGSAKAARLSATGTLISTAMLARFTSSVAKLAKRSGKGSGTLRKAALAGGGLAVVALANSAVSHLRLTTKVTEDDSMALKLANRVFVSGGIVHGVGFGVLTGSLAVAGLRTGELPKPLAYAGLASAASSLLSPVYFVWKPGGWFIPGGRFSGLLIFGIAGAKMARK